MGGDFIEAGFCDGDDVLKKLNDVFGIPGSAAFETAWAAREEFNKVGTGNGNVELLIGAYKAAGVDVDKFPNWRRYLTLLGTAGTQGPANISAIAKMRYQALTEKKGTSTIVHQPEHGGHVHVEPGAGNQPHVISSPCPMPQPPKKKY
jgi:hypothetical protein